jgi:hypothetical protein
VITGKIGDKGDLPKGNYRADYGPLGAVTFRVVDCVGQASGAARN